MTRRLDLILLLLGIGALAVDLGAVFLQVDLSRGFRLGDAVALFGAPLVVPGLAWAAWLSLGRADPSRESSLVARIMFVGSVWYASGVGLNIGASAIARQLACADPSLACRLTFLLDERLGHFLWHGGELVLAFGLAVAAGREGRLAAAPRLGPILGGVCFGFTWFANAVEGQSTVLVLPAALALLGYLRVTGRRIPAPLANPMVVFLAVTAVVAVALLLIWGVWHRGFPEFSELGWI